MDIDRKPSLKIRRLIALIVIIIALLLITRIAFTIFSGGGENKPMSATNTTDNTGPVENNPASTGPDYSIQVGLREGQAATKVPEKVPTATSEPLSPEEIEAIFARLPGLPVSPDEETEFKYPVELLPPPRPGTTIAEKFPPRGSTPPPEVAPTGPLEVLRFAPEGEISIAPFVSITFSQPMVPLGTLADLAAGFVPVQISPALPGTWRWLGTRTLTFEYDSALIDRLPKATNYQVTVPAGTKSIDGAQLAKSVSWTFSTPSLKLVDMYPHDSPQPLQPLIYAAFDQRIDPAAVLKTIQVFAANEQYDLTLASQSEIEKDEQVSQSAKNAPEGRWLAFKAVKPFPPDTSVSITIGPGTPSAEGPLVTPTAQSFEFRTYAALRITDHGCQWGGGVCRPMTPFIIQFNNPIDEKYFAEAMLQVTPEIPGFAVSLYGQTIVISGETRGQTTYKVNVSAALRDIFDQTLGKDQQLNFTVGNAEAGLYGPDQAFMTVDPAAKKPVFSVYAINYAKLAVKIYSVQPTDWDAFAQYWREWRRTDSPDMRMPGELVFDKTIPLNIPDNTLSEVDIELSPYLRNGFGHFVVVAQPPEGMFDSQDDKKRRFYQTVYAWVQVTHIGIDAYTDYSDMVVWATDLNSGKPLENITVQPNNGGKFTTNAKGTARIDIPAGATYLVASRGADTAMLLHSSSIWQDSSWQPGDSSDGLSWYVFDDRQMYRPGEDVHLKGWIRRIGGRQNGDVSLVGDAVHTLAYQMFDGQGNSIGEGQTYVNGLGGFDFAVTIPQTVNLGYARLYLSLPDSQLDMVEPSYNHMFQIQEFRRPEYEVTAQNVTAGPYFAGGKATVSVEAKYYAGGPLVDSDVTWEVETTPANYAPPKWPDFVFGKWQPWWQYYDGIPEPHGETQTFTGKTDANGVHYLELDLKQPGQPGQNPTPVSISAHASVMDVNRQAWGSTTNLLVHPADIYVGLRSERYFVERGTPLKVDFIVTDLDGNPVIDRPVLITAARLEWKLREGKWAEQEVDIQKCSKTSKAGPDSCLFETTVGGSYRITALVTDDQGRKNQTRLTRWVSGGQRPVSRNVEQEEVTLVPEKQTYQPGDTAEILVQSPFSPAEGLLTVSRSGFLYTTRFQVKDGSTTLTVPIKAEYIPNLNIQVDLVGSTARTNELGEPLTNIPPRPAYATAQLELSIPPLQRTLSLQVEPEDRQLEPGGKTTIRAVVKDSQGRPVPQAELAVVVVDEAVLALTNYQMVDPISVFYRDRASGVSSTYGRESILLVNPLDLQGKVADQGMGGAFGPTGTAAPATQAPAMMAPSDESANGAGQQTSVAVRSDFNPLAAFAPTVRSGSNGEAVLSVKVPDNLTRYRIMVVAVDEAGRQFGLGESNLTARLPLMVRPSAPRFLNFGDKFELPVVIQNQSDQALTVEVVARATNLELAEAGKRVSVPANDRIEVRFPASTKKAGTARIQIAAVSGSFADAATVELPVYTPATTEAFATYGVIDTGAVAQPVLQPTGVFPQYGGLEISTSSTALQALTDAVLYLTSYPYECSEQLSSRILAVASLRDVLSAFKADGLPSSEEMQAAVIRDIKRLQGLQNYDGGFPYWRQGFESIPFNTIHVAHALHMAEQKGFEVPHGMQQGLSSYLRDIESHYPSWYGDQTRSTLSAYALYVRNLSGDRDAQKAQRLLQDEGLENLSVEAIGWLWTVIDNEDQLGEIRTFVNNHVVETAGAANFTTSYDDQTYLLLSSDRRTDAILLDALMEDDPKSDLIPKVVNGLLAHRTKGRWGNTQENVFVLLSLDRYFNTYEAETPDFVAQIWLGDTYAGSHEFQGRTTELHETLIPMNYVLSETGSGGGTEELIINKAGAGRLYYRLGLQYAPTDLHMKPLDMGFVVQRRYEALDDPEDVSQDTDGVWHIRAGARVRIHISLAAADRRYHVAMVDPLPAGLEIVNPALAVSQNAPQDDPIARPYGWWWQWTWYEHQNLRDDRAEAFTSLLWDGVYEYTYIARATTPGTFVVPPAKAEEMYSPEVFGRSGADWVIVK